MPPQHCVVIVQTVLRISNEPERKRKRDVVRGGTYVRVVNKNKNKVEETRSDQESEWTILIYFSVFWAFQLFPCIFEDFSVLILLFHHYVSLRYNILTAYAQSP